MMTCCWRPTPVSDSSSWMSSRRQAAPLIEYSLSPDRNSVRVMVISARSVASLPALLSMVRETSARPRAGRLAVPMKMTSSILAERTVRGPWAPSTQATASTTLDLPLPFGTHHDGDAGLEFEHRRVGEGLESFEGEGLQEHRALTLPVAAHPGTPGSGRTDR